MLRLDLADVVVIGGGYVGQLVQLSIPSVRVLDWRKSAPANHLETRVGPQYLWEPIPKVPSVSFPVTTLVDGQPPTEESIRAYKKKIGKLDDGGNWGLQFQHEMVGWHSELPIPRIEYNRTVERIELHRHELHLVGGAVIEYDALINTIPLPSFLKLCTIPPVVLGTWRADPIYMMIGPNLHGPSDGMILNYIADPSDPYYRRTLDGFSVYYETLIAGHGGNKLLPGKIHTHPESEAVLRSLKVWDVFCFGRYATWRPDELAHETWQQIQTWKGTV